jgi:hypothetical protein
MRVSAFVLVVTLAMACGGQQQRQRSEITPVVSQREDSPSDRPTGTAGANPTGVSGPAIASPAAAKETTAALADFQKRVEAYAALHQDLAKGSAKQRETSDPAKIDKAETALAAKVQAARGQAKQGDVFTPAVQPVFRRLLAPELKGPEGRDTKAILADDAPPASAIPFKVNAKYPESQPLPTVPAGVLATLPVLPAPLEYRIVGRHLLLLDTASDVIVDYILNATPR